MAKNTFEYMKDHIFELRNKIITMINHRIYIPRTSAVVKLKPEKKRSLNYWFYLLAIETIITIVIRCFVDFAYVSTSLQGNVHTYTSFVPTRLYRIRVQE